MRRPSCALVPATGIRLAGAPAISPTPRRRRLWAALAASAALHGVAAFALGSGLLTGAEAAGQAGDAAQSLPESPALMVQLLTPADLVSAAQPQLEISAPDLAPQMPQGDLAMAPAATEDTAVARPALSTLAPPVQEVGPVVSQTTPPPPDLPVAETVVPKKPKAQPAKPKPADKPVKKAKAAPKAANADAGGKPAKGSGGGVAAGTDGTAKAGLTKGRIKDLRAEWGGAVRSKVERKRSYPAAAKGAAGTVKVRLTLAPAGQLLGVSVVASSGNAALDAAALKAVKTVGRFPKAPKGLTDASYSFTLPMRFEP
ncbi:MAG: TonB family protein [Paracoccaceae bacterium]